MYDLKTAKAWAADYAAVQGLAWSVVKTPADAECNRPPFNTYNTGRYVPVLTSEVPSYVEGGCELVEA